MPFNEITGEFEDEEDLLLLAPIPRLTEQDHIGLEAAFLADEFSATGTEPCVQRGTLQRSNLQRSYLQ